MTTETRSAKADIKKIQREIAAVRARIAHYQKTQPGKPFPFAKLHGIWKGKVRFTEEDIEAAKVSPRDFPG